jgi:8-oxo-dGTP diphosphatase
VSGERAEPRTRLAAYALCVDDARRILLCRIAPGYPAAGGWTLPGGGVDFGEDPADTCLRELAEETGLTGRIRRLSFVSSVRGEHSAASGGGPWHGVRIVYEVEVAGGTLRDETDESTDRAEWIGLDRARDLPLVDLAQAALDAVEGSGDQSTVK